MSSYLAQLHANQICFPKSNARFLHNLFYLVDSLKEEEIRLNIVSGYEKFRDCVKEEGLDGITLFSKWERDNEGYKCLAYHAVIKPKLLLAQLVKYSVAQ